MKKEDPPYEFKIHLFLDSKSQKRDDESESQRPSLSHREINLQVMKKLAEFGAINIKDTPMNQGRDKGEKIRYLFDIDDRDQALACFRFFNDYYGKRFLKNLIKRQLLESKKLFDLTKITKLLI